MIGVWTIVNIERTRRYPRKTVQNRKAVPLYERWEIAQDAEGRVSAKQTGQKARASAPWKDAALGPFAMQWYAPCGSFLIRNDGGTLLITGISDGDWLHGQATVNMAECIKYEAFEGWREKEADL